MRGEAFCYRAEARLSLGLVDEAASDFELAIAARRDWLRKNGQTGDAGKSDELVYKTAFKGLASIREQHVPSV